MEIKIKRVYEDAEAGDGFRVLADRLWPRGVTKEKAKVDLWLKDATPSNELRKWVHEDREGRMEAFAEKYQDELKEVPKETFESLTKHETITLLTAAKDAEHSHVPVLKAFLEHLK